MQFNSPATELTTGATDATLAFLCVFIIARIRKCRARSPWKAGLWSWVFGLLAASSFLGAAAHGFALSSGSRNLLWQPLYLALGVDVALFVLGAIADSHGDKCARRLLPLVLVIGIVFYSLTAIIGGNFLVFVIYEGVAMITAMLIYASLALRRSLPGAGTIASGVALTLIAAGLQSSALGFTLVWPFDHNGLFHLVQMPALVILGSGLRARLKSSS